VDVKRIVGFVLLGSALGIVFFVFYFVLSSSEDDPGDAPPWWTSGVSYSGTVTAITPENLKIKDRDNVDREFRIDANTRFFLWGNDPVRPGVSVKVSYKLIRDGDKSSMLARSVRVLKPGADASASPSPDASKQPSPAASVEPSPDATGKPSPDATGKPSPDATGKASPDATARPSPGATTTPSPLPNPG
jgi:hypothetical protein